MIAIIVVEGDMRVRVEESDTAMSRLVLRYANLLIHVLRISVVILRRSSRMPSLK